jgi:hypothetical protein
MRVGKYDQARLEFGAALNGGREKDGVEYGIEDPNRKISMINMLNLRYGWGLVDGLGRIMLLLSWVRLRLCWQRRRNRRVVAFKPVLVYTSRISNFMVYVTSLRLIGKFTQSRFHFKNRESPD